MTTDPVAVALKFAFLIVLYLFLLWVARSSLRDMTRTRTRASWRTRRRPAGERSGDARARTCAPGYSRASR